MGKKHNIIPNSFKASLTRLSGAVFSGRRSAYLALVIKLIKPITHLIDAGLYFLSFPSKSRAFSPTPVMIVSPPRSGSTIIFQSLVRVLPGMYISNFHALFPRHASQRINQRNSPIPYRYKNYYGYTANINDVYEGNEFINPIFSNPSDIQSIKDKFDTLSRKIKTNPGQPFIFKNVRNYNKAVQLSKALPEALFIRIKRNPEQVIQSEHRAFKELKTFHPIPDALLNTDIQDPLEFNVRQILEIEREIDEQSRQIDPSKWIEWEYEDFCKDPIAHIQALARDYLKMPLSELRSDWLTFTLKASERKKVSDEEAARIEQLINTIKQG